LLVALLVQAALLKGKKKSILSAAVLLWVSAVPLMLKRNKKWDAQAFFFVLVGKGGCQRLDWQAHQVFLMKALSRTS